MTQLIKGKQIASQSVTISGSTGNVIISGDINVGGYQVNVTNYPITNTQLANKAYVDAVAQGVSPHSPVLVVSVNNITTMSGVTTIDNVSLVDGDRILLSGQIDKRQNGLFNINSGSSWTRTLDANGDPNNEIEIGDFVFVLSGVTNGSTGWVLGKSDSTDEFIQPDTETQEWYKMAAPGTYSTDNEGITLDGTVFKLVIDGTSLTKTPSGLKVSSGYTSSIETAISNEISTRTGADVSLATAISTTMSTEVATRSSADLSLSTSLSSEISTRTGADLSLSTSLSSEISTRTGADISLATVISTTMSTEVATRSSADASLATAINDLNSPNLYSENILPSNSGSTNNVIVSTNTFIFPAGNISLNSISVHLNGIQYNFNYTQSTGIVFYTSSTPTAGSPVTLYFDGTQADFTIETTDEVNIKFTTIL